METNSTKWFTLNERKKIKSNILNEKNRMGKIILNKIKTK